LEGSKGSGLKWFWEEDFVDWEPERQEVGRKGELEGISER